MDLDTVLRGALPPIVAVLLFVSFAGVRLLPLAMAIGLYVAYGLLKQAWPSWPHELWSEPNGMEWLLWGTVTLALVAVLEHLRVLPPRVANSAAPAVGAAVAWFMLQKVASHWTGSEVVLFVGTGGLLVALTIVATRTTLARAEGSVVSAAVFATVLSVDTVLVTFGKSAFLGQLCGAVAAAVGTAAVTCSWRRGFSLRAADGAWLGGAHVLFVLAAVHLAYLEWWPAACALLAPFLLLLLPRALAQDRKKVWMVVAVALTAVPLAVGLGLAWPEPNPYGY